MTARLLAAAAIVGFATAALVPVSDAASITASVTESVIGVGESSTVNLFLSLAPGEEASVFEGRFGLSGLDTVATVALTPGGPTWTSVAGGINGGDAVVSLTSNNTGGDRLVAQLTVMGLSNGTLDILFADALAAFDIPGPPFLDQLTLTNAMGDTLASVAVVPVPPALLLLLSGLGLTAACRRGTAHQPYAEREA
ncbi:MAG: hypothetical protein AAFX85_01550 [Pseudomonadota bacterium]